MSYTAALEKMEGCKTFQLESLCLLLTVTGGSLYAVHKALEPKHPANPPSFLKAAVLLIYFLLDSANAAMSL